MLRQNRICRELERCHRNLDGYFTCKPDDDDLSQWTFHVAGPPDTAYEGGCWRLRMYFPSEFPFEPPQLHFSTPILHPNVHPVSGQVYCDLLDHGWSPGMTLESVVIVLRHLLTEPADMDRADC